MAEDPVPLIARQLRLKGSRREQVIRELDSHLEASRHDLQLAGNSPEAATRESVRRFGDPGEVAEMLSTVHRRRLWRSEFVLTAAVALAALSAWLGTSHTFASSGHTHHPAHAACHSPAVKRVGDAHRRCLK
jgi:anti-sigma-K factor RskA